MNLIDPAVRRCIDDCVRCHEVCLSTLPYCLEQGGRHATVEHITLLLDCANICQASADFMLRASDEHGRICASCAAICIRCAANCEEFVGDEVMQACAESCRQCADSCTHMAATHA
jgi:hypothetical protein